MKHYQVTAPGEITCLEKPDPRPGTGEVLVRITHTAISPGSNTYIYRTGSYTGRWEGVPQDCVYMGSGEVIELGDGVDDLRVGDRVSMNGVGHQELAVMPRRKVHRLPEGVSSEAASLSYLAGWAVSALHLGRYAAAETVAVIGLGLVGSSAALVADMMGARVLAIDVASERVAFAEQAGSWSVSSRLVLQMRKPPSATSLALGVSIWCSKQAARGLGFEVRLRFVDPIRGSL